MRSYRLIILLFLAACKASAPSTSSAPYSEDLSVHRPEIVLDENELNGNTEEAKTEDYQPLSGHIKSELDSIAKIALIENTDGKMVDGFVIQVYSGNDRGMANQIRNKMNESFPELKAKVTWHQPNFRVKAGQFTNRLRANRIHEEIKSEFPKALLLPDRFLLKYE